MSPFFTLRTCTVGARAVLLALFFQVKVAPVAAFDDTRPEHAGLRLATWNIEWLRPNFKPGSPVRRSGKDYAALAEEFARLAPDVLAIQEVASVGMMERLTGPGGHYRTILEKRKGEQRVGFTIRRTLSWQRHPDVLLAGRKRHIRNGVHISLVYRGERYHLLSVHLVSGCQRDPLTGDRKACKRLYSQLQPLECWLKKWSKEGVAIILGDFNRPLAEKEPFWVRLSQQTTLYSPTLGQKDHCPARTGNFLPHTLIDHVVMAASGSRAPALTSVCAKRQLWSQRRASIYLLSDHCPVYVDL